MTTRTEERHSINHLLAGRTEPLDALVQPANLTWLLRTPVNEAGMRRRSRRHEEALAADSPSSVAFQQRVFSLTQASAYPWRRTHV
jgi:hypothetical protein